MSGLDRIREWYAQRGWSPFAFQEEVWRAYNDCRSGLIHAATGTGKTYAAWLGPVIEWLDTHETRPATQKKRSRADADPLTVLWITPLRALANDLVGALRRPVDDLGIPWTIETRTGDTKQGQRQKQRDRLPSALITTPESLSVLLSYPDSRERLQSVRVVIVDEWHELLSTKRGVQVELALARLRRWSPGLRVWGLSATLANLQQACDVLVGGSPGNASNGIVVSGDQPKEYSITTVIPPSVERFPWSGHLGLKLLPEVIAAVESAGSTLVFCNVRSQAEAWYQAIIDMRPDLEPVAALHHGSIDRKIREAVENRLRAGELRCVVCTSSLDLGVDFTPVDQVIQVGSPKGIARLLQRAGRSGHQPGATSRVLGVPTHAFELVEFAAARSAVDRREVESRQPLDRPMDVLVQHLVTIGLGGGFTSHDLLEEVRSSYAFAKLSDIEWQWALDFVVHGGTALRAYPQFNRLTERDGTYIVDNQTIARLHRLSIGTITGDPVMELRYVGGKRLGTIEESFISRMKPGDRFVFAGKVLQLARVRDLVAFVRLAKGGKGQYPRWMGGKLSFSTQLGDAVREKLYAAADGRANEAEMRAVAPILTLQERWSSIPRPDQLQIELVKSREGWHAFIFPFEGRLVHEGLGAIAAFRLATESARSIAITANDYGFELLSAQPLPTDESAWRMVLSADLMIEDLLLSLNAAEMDKRQFREIARVAGLVFPGYPGMPKSARQLQASSGLFYDVFVRYDPSNLLLDQARREVLDRQLEVMRLRSALTRIASLELSIVTPKKLTPLGFPIWADRIQTQHVTSEGWGDRVRRMAEQLEKSASK